MKKIATEEAFATPAVVAEWEKLLDDGAPGEPGFKLQVGYFRTATDNFTKRVTERLVEFGELRLQEMDNNGIDMQLLSLTAPGVQVFDADTGTALARETNDFLVETVNNNPARYAGLAAVAPQAPKSASRELERATGLGLKGAIINSHTKGEYLDAVAYWPILEAAESLDVPIYIHPNAVAPSMIAPFAERNMAEAFWGFQTETALHALRLMVTGIFDRFPNLKIVLGHLGEGIPFWLDRLDRQFANGRRTPDRSPTWKAERLPSDYFRDNFYVTSSGHNWDPAVRFTEEVVGEDRLLFAIDYPYASNKQQTEQAATIELKNPDKFYHLNAQKVFKLD